MGHMLSEIENLATVIAEGKEDELNDEKPFNRNIMLIKTKLSKSRKWLEGNLLPKQLPIGEEFFQIYVHMRRSLVNNRNESPSEYEKIAYEKLLSVYFKEKHWTPKAIEKIDTLVDLALKKYDYFLSFTRRDTPVVGYSTGHLINIDYKYIIAECMGLPFNEIPVNSKENLVASSIHRRLKANSLKGFYFPRYEGNQEEVLGKCRKGIEDSFVLIQIIQFSMFKGVNKSICFHEYKHAKDTYDDKDRLVFLLTERYPPTQQEKAEKIDIPTDEREEWYDYVFNKNIAHLKCVDNIGSARSEVVERLNKLIETLKSIQKQTIIRLIEPQKTA